MRRPTSPPGKVVSTRIQLSDACKPTWAEVFGSLSLVNVVGRAFTDRDSEVKTAKETRDFGMNIVVMDAESEWDSQVVENDLMQLDKINHNAVHWGWKESEECLLRGLRQTSCVLLYGNWLPHSVWVIVEPSASHNTRPGSIGHNIRSQEVCGPTARMLRTTSSNASIEGALTQAIE